MPFFFISSTSIHLYTFSTNSKIVIRKKHIQHLGLQMMLTLSSSIGWFDFYSVDKVTLSKLSYIIPNVVLLGTLTNILNLSLVCLTVIK